MNKSFIKTLSACFTILLLSCFSLPSLAQEPELSEIDTTAEEEILMPVTVPDGEKPVDIADTLGPVPGIAAFYSAVLPGLGQAYNNSHWKIPIIYAGAVFLGWRILDQHKRYSSSRQNLVILERNPAITEIGGMDLSRWDRRVIVYRRGRDYAIVLGGILYMLNIVEAYTDAHLQDFNVTDDLALKIKPSLMAMPGGTPGAGIALTLHIK